MGMFVDDLDRGRGGECVVDILPPPNQETCLRKVSKVVVGDSQV